MTKEFFNRNVFSVVIENGKKQIKIEQYFFQEDGNVQCVEFTFCYIDIPATIEQSQIAEEMCKQYQGDCSDKEYEKYCKKVLSKLPIMSVEDVDENTPCGTYIS